VSGRAAWWVAAASAVCLLWLCPGPVRAQEGRSPSPIDVPTVLAQLTAHNGELRQARLAVDRAELVWTGERLALAPVLTLDASYAHSDEPTQGLFENGLRITDVVRGQGQIAQRLPWGTTLALVFDATRVHTFQPFQLPGGGRQVTEIGPNWDERLAFTLRQPLLRGSGRAVNTANVALAEQQRDVASLEVERSASTVVLEALTRYLELVAAHEDVAIKARQLEILDGQRAATEALLEAGRVAATELDVLDQRVLVLEEARLVANHQRDVQSLELARVLGADGPEVTYAPSGLPELGSILADDAALDAAARAHNPELRLLREQLDAKRIELATTEDATLPQLDLTLSVGQRGLSADGFFDAGSQLVTLDAGNVALGATFSMPLGADRATQQHEATRLDIVQIEARIEDTERRIASEVHKAARLARLNAQRVDLSERSVLLARKNLTAEQSRFQSGLSTNQAVLQVEEELERAEVKASRARVDVLAAQLQVLHLTGELVGTAVTAQPALTPRPPLPYEGRGGGPHPPAPSPL